MHSNRYCFNICVFISVQSIVRYYDKQRVHTFRFVFIYTLSFCNNLNVSAICVCVTIITQLYGYFTISVLNYFLFKIPVDVHITIQVSGNNQLTKLQNYSLCDIGRQSLIKEINAWFKTVEVTFCARIKLYIDYVI